MQYMKEIHIHKYQRSIGEDGNIIYTCAELGCGYSVNFTHERVKKELREWWKRKDKTGEVGENI